MSDVRDDGLTHLDADGRARMVDVNEKASTKRTAVAEGRIRMADATLEIDGRVVISNGVMP